jgi:oligopeptide transport system substrate-binding protein
MTTGQANNNAQWSNSKYDELIDQSRYIKGEDRDKLIYEAEKILMEDMPISPIYYYTDPVMVQNNIKGWQKNSMSYWYFGVTSIE